ncbi:MAG: carbamoyltransferase HypF [Leptospiraceae bacterium]|nr:carbamoyltransferase HypF [Leptospiraceae bacterium]
MNFADQSLRRALNIQGAVQGVGFRPFVYKLATELGLGGRVYNSGTGVCVEIEGHASTLDLFQRRLNAELPPGAHIRQIRQAELPPAAYSDFQILPSDTSGQHFVSIPPDRVPCSDCLRELNNPHNRRYGYAFINCTHCGPRFSILMRPPFDRERTSMREFRMCPACRSEFENPADRRYHAQAICCPDCGPHLRLRTGTDTMQSRSSAEDQEIIRWAVELLRAGRILACKGVGGYQLLVDATNSAAVRELRRRKRRKRKPFALMMNDVDMIVRYCHLTDAELRSVLDPGGPIVLLRRRIHNAITHADGYKNVADITPSVAPDNAWLGVMLPSSPLHVLLMRAWQGPLIATSGNLSDEPICFTDADAFERLGSIADAFLFYNRDIVRPLDDSIVRLAGDRAIPLRVARGQAPVRLSVSGMPGVLAFGAHMKNTVSYWHASSELLVSAHGGDLGTLAARENCQHTVRDLLSFVSEQPIAIACDAHPDYASTNLARAFAHEHEIPLYPVQHHYAHLLAVIAEHDGDHVLTAQPTENDGVHVHPPQSSVTSDAGGTLMGFCWDGVGYGADGGLWGGELLELTPDGYRRRAGLRPWSLPGGEAAVRFGWRNACGLLFEMYGNEWRSHVPDCILDWAGVRELQYIDRMLVNEVHCPRTSSVGRLFDAVAALLGICGEADYEGEAALLVEAQAQEHLQHMATEYVNSNTQFINPRQVHGAHHIQLDWAALVEVVLTGRQSQGALCLQLHTALVRSMTDVLALLRADGYINRAGPVVLAGGCFQNAILLDRAVRELRHHGYRVWHARQLPPGDGAISVGQALAVARELQPHMQSEPSKSMLITKKSAGAR